MKDVNDDHVTMPNFPGNLLNYFAFSSSASFEKKTFHRFGFGEENFISLIFGLFRTELNWRRRSKSWYFSDSFGSERSSTD